jgi:hypothetical protein
VYIEVKLPLRSEMSLKFQAVEIIILFNSSRGHPWEDNIKRDLQEVGGDCGD